jgi:hypothetical protein
MAKFFIPMLILAILEVIVAPFAAIWALNILFLMAIPYTFNTWLAALLLIMLVKSNTTVFRSK